MSKKIKTEHIKSVLSEQESDTFYKYFIDTIEWEEGVRSKLGFTRLAKAMNNEIDPMVSELISLVVSRLLEKSQNLKTDMVGVAGIYLNYYKDGTHWTPNHSHKGTMQIVISLGTDRILQIAKKDYTVSKGDVAIFGSAIHGVPKSDTTEGRISVAFFLIKND